MRYTSILVLLLVFAAPVISGSCSWVGRTAGKVQAKMERKADDVESGYQQGYEQEKAKNAKAEGSSSGQ